MNPAEKEIKETAVVLDGVLNCNESFLVRLNRIESNAFPLAEKMWKLKRVTNFLVCLAVAIGVGESYRAVGTFDLAMILNNIPLHATVYLMVAVALIIFNKMVVLKSFKAAHQDINMATSIRIETNLVDDEVRQRITAYLKKVGKFNEEIEDVLAKAKYVEPVIIKEPIDLTIKQSNDQRIKSDLVKAQETLHKNLMKRLAVHPEIPETIMFSSILALTSLATLNRSELNVWDYSFGLLFLVMALVYLVTNIQAVKRLKALIDGVLKDDVTVEHINGVKKLVCVEAPYTFAYVGLHMIVGLLFTMFFVGGATGSYSLAVVNFIACILALIGGTSLMRTMYLCARNSDVYKQSNGMKKKK